MFLSIAWVYSDCLTGRHVLCWVSFLKSLNVRYYLFNFYYPEDNADRHKVHVCLRIAAIYALVVALVSIIVALQDSLPSPLSEKWASTLAVIAVVSSVLQFIPQIIYTAKLKVRRIFVSNL